MSKLVNSHHGIRAKVTDQGNQDCTKNQQPTEQCITPWVIIPARLNSRRLPRKPLLDLGGRPMIARVVEAVSTAVHHERIVVVSDAHEVLDASRHAHPAPGKTILIPEVCHSGSDRVRHAYLQKLQCTSHTPAQDEWIINVQGDEPLLPATSLSQLISSLPIFERQGVKIVTLAAPLPECPQNILKDSAAVKACLSLAQSDQPHLREALYFSRKPIGNHLHLGVYAFHSSALPLIAKPRTPLSLQEDLEQLTWMEYGARVGVVCLDAIHPPGVDTPGDLERTRQLYLSQTSSQMEDHLLSDQSIQAPTNNDIPQEPP